MKAQDISLNKSRNTWVGNYRNGKKRTRYTLGNLREFKGCTAEEVQAVLSERYEKGLERFLNECKEEEKKGLLLQNLLEKWLTSIASSRDVKTYDHYRLDLLRFLHVSPLRVGELTSAVQEKYYDHLRTLGLSDSSINSSVRSVRVFIKWLAEQELLKHPVTLKALRTVKKRPQYYSAVQIAQMLNYCRTTPGRRYTLLYRSIWILSQTGMRGGELLNLQWNEVEKNRIKITSREDWKVKNRKDSSVPISPKLRMEMSDWDKSGEIWVLDTGNQQKYWSHLNELTASMRFVQNKCDCRGPKPLHGFRAGVATELLRQGASPVHVQRLLRHEDLSTTMGYLDPDALEIQELVSKL